MLILTLLPERVTFFSQEFFLTFSPKNFWTWKLDHISRVLNHIHLLQPPSLKVTFLKFLQDTRKALWNSLLNSRFLSCELTLSKPILKIQGHGKCLGPEEQIFSHVTNIDKEMKIFAIWIVFYMYKAHSFYDPVFRTSIIIDR